MGQPARSEENFVIDLKSSIERALGSSCPHCSLCRNLPLLDPVEDELAREPGPVGGPYSGSTSPAVSCNPTPGPELVPALNLTPIPTPVLAPAPHFSNELFKQFMRAYLESNQGPKQPSAECERSLNTKIPEVYYVKSHIDCYHFYQQCEDHFETAGGTGTNRTPFTAFFLRGNINVHWT